MKQKVNYWSLAFLFAFLLGSQAVFAQSTLGHIYKGDVQPKRERMPNIINKLLYDEYAPAISPDGKTLVYQSNENGKKWQTFHLWESRRDSTGFWAVPKPIDAINSKAVEGNQIGGPSISYDGSTLFFHAFFDGGKGNNDIYLSVRKKDEKGNWGDWAEPMPLNGTVNTDKDESFPSISSDGARLYYTLGDAANDTVKTNRKGTNCYKLMVSKRQLDGSWSAPEELPAPINKACDKYIRVMPDNQSVFFSSTSAGRGAKGSPKDSDDFDLYWSELQPDNSWSEPVATDMSPFVKSTFYSYQPDMLVSIAPHDEPHVKAYFSAYMGASHEIFTLDVPKQFGPRKTCMFRGIAYDSMENKPLEVTIKQTNNTRTWLSTDYKNDAKSGRFSSVLTEGNKYTFVVTAQGYVDYKFTSDLSKEEMEWACEKVVRMVKKGIKLNVEIVDGTDETVFVDAPLSINDLNGKAQTEIKKSDKGKYNTVIDPGKYKATAGKVEDYEPSTIDVDLSNKKAGETVTVRIKMFNVPNAQFGIVNFRTARPNKLDTKELAAGLEIATEGQANQKERNKTVVDVLDGQVLPFMKDYPSAKIVVRAHTDDRGGDAFNQALSERRAAAVKQYLVSKGVAESRIRVESFGETQPQVPNDSVQNLALNRRVVIEVDKK
ncbi:MAG: hypothetical protein EAZ97_09650 [Bacteroidetes bacterium]|nr:MAG: hypothetical protein EAZ97_09650 [Bacteroidota bacterium]